MRQSLTIDYGSKSTPRAVLSTVPSDSHTWNLVYLELLLQELGFNVTNMGACTPIDMVIGELTTDPPDILVVSSVNGHGAREATQLIQAVRACGFEGPAVLGGKLGCGDSTDALIPSRLSDAGFAAVYMDGAPGGKPVAEFAASVKQLAMRSTETMRAGYGLT